ncbi:unnamed protein product [Phaeothamnion confervicola]
MAAGGGMEARRSASVARLGFLVAVGLFALGYMIAILGWDVSVGNAEPPAATRGKSGIFETFEATNETPGDVSVEPTLLVYNSYTKDAPVQEYGWEHLAEPYRPTTMQLMGWPAAGPELDYSWVVDDHLQGYGTICDVAFTSLGYHTVVVTAFIPPAGGGEAPQVGAAAATIADAAEGEATAAVVTSATFAVMVKYVRREIRALTDADREAFFNAVSVLQRVPTSVGRALYGDDYYSKDYFVRVHLYYGGMKSCDHWHQGAGFVTSHVAYTLMFERALQAVNPSVTVPFWDFTIESTFYGAEDWRNSPVFSGDWFGEAAPSNTLRTVTAGRFAYAPAMAQAREFSALTNSYGLLRGPWNNDPTPFMTRSDTVAGYSQNLKPSGCAEYFKAMRKETWMSLAAQLNAAAHGHIHETVGGSWNHFYMRETGSAGPVVYDFAHLMQALTKELWRAGFLTCPNHCGSGAPWRECQCTCDAASLRGLSPYDVLREAGILNQTGFFNGLHRPMVSKRDADGTVMFGFEGFSDAEAAHAYKSMLRTLCAPGHMGDMFQATSPNDVTFWVLHPTLDRLWHWKRLADDTGFDHTWIPTGTCYGHDPEQLQPFKNLFDSDDRYYSNAELYRLLDPRNDDLPYVYANFEWPHCELLGYDMSKRVV